MALSGLYSNMFGGNLIGGNSRSQNNNPYAGLPGDYPHNIAPPNYGVLNNPYATNTSQGVYVPWTSWHVDPNGRYPGGDVSKIGITGLAPALFEQIGFANQLEPMREQMIQNFITQNNPANSNYLVSAARRNALSQANATQQQLGASGFYGGAFTDPAAALQEANQAGTEAYGQVHSPGYQNQLYSNVLGGIGEGQNLSLLPAMQGFTQMNITTPRAAPGGLAAVGSILGGALSSALGGGLSGLFSGGGQTSGNYSGPSPTWGIPQTPISPPPAGLGGMPYQPVLGFGGY